MQKQEPKEIDSNNEAVAYMHERIRTILSKAKTKPKTRKGLTVPENEKHVIQCRRILKLDAERRLVNIIVEKTDGGLRQIRIEASED